METHMDVVGTGFSFSGGSPPRITFALTQPPELTLEFVKRTDERYKAIRARPDDLLSLEQLTERLHATPSWIRENIRRRCPNPLPTFNVGRRLIFSWTQVSEWARNSSCPIQAPHHRRRIAKVA